MSDASEALMKNGKRSYCFGRFVLITRKWQIASKFFTN